MEGSSSKINFHWEWWEEEPWRHHPIVVVMGRDNNILTRIRLRSFCIKPHEARRVQFYCYRQPNQTKPSQLKEAKQLTLCLAPYQLVCIALASDMGANQRVPGAQPKPILRLQPKQFPLQWWQHSQHCLIIKTHLMRQIATQSSAFLTTETGLNEWLSSGSQTIQTTMNKSSCL